MKQPLTAPHRTEPMEHWRGDHGRLPAEVFGSRYISRDGVDEVQLMIRPTGSGGIVEQLAQVERAYQLALDSADLAPETAVWRRFFCSDLPNQAAPLTRRPFADPTWAGNPCAVSWVGQPPAPPAKVALWASHLADASGPLAKRQRGTTMSLTRGALTHHWTTNLLAADRDSSFDQTRAIFDRYGATLREKGLTLADHVVRTWLFVQNVDANYEGLVVARRELFEREGLTAATHYIASTGIEGRAAEVAARVAMDAYAIGGLRPSQVQYLTAPDHLSPTHLYGVTFERGVAIGYRDRKQIFISGTASIDHRGEILHPGDVARQLDRTLENIQALLRQGGATFRAVGQFVVYVRDPSDQPLVEALMRDRFPAMPMLVVVAPVCRPGWLIELECSATIAIDRPDLPAF